MAVCCAPYIEGSQPAPTAEALMRSRYTAFVTQNFPYLHQTVSSNLQEQFIPETLAHETQETVWTGLHVQKVHKGKRTDTLGEVTYTAKFEQNGIPGILRERSQFVKQNGAWEYTGGTLLTDPGLMHQELKPGRNTPCPCGSGKKYKKCCGR